VDGSFGDIEDGGGFGVGGAGEGDEFEELDFAGVDGGEFIEGGVDGEEVGGGVTDGGELGEGDLLAAVAFEAFAAAGVIDEDAAHGAGGDGEEVVAVDEVDFGVGLEAEVGFVDEGGGGEGVAGAFAAELLAGDGAELGVELVDDLIERRSIAVLPGVEESCDGWACVGHTGRRT
jgi:hypothetical protein